MRGEKAAQLLLTVLRRTEEGKVPWTETSTAGAFEASFPSNTLRVSMDTRFDEDAQEPYDVPVLEIINDKGKTIESIDSGGLRDILDKPWELTNRLYEMAKDQALGIESTIDSILHDLGGPIALPQKPDNEIPF